MLKEDNLRPAKKHYALQKVTLIERFSDYTKEELEKAVSKLGPKTKQYIILLYGETLDQIPSDESINQIGKTNVRATVQQLKKKLENPMESKRQYHSRTATLAEKIKEKHTENKYLK